MDNDVALANLYNTVRDLRTLGFTDEEIAINKKLALNVVSAIPPPRPEPQRQRAVQHSQLMRMAQALMPRVANGENDAIQLMLKVMQREANLLGLDAPKEVISHNFNQDQAIHETDYRNMTTEELRRRVYQVIDGTAERIQPDPAEPDPPAER